jgi:hypothetical protein
MHQLKHTACHEVARLAAACLPGRSTLAALLCVTALVEQAHVLSFGSFDAAAYPAAAAAVSARQAGVVKAHMLLLAHLERLGSQVPPALQADYK